MSDPDFAAPVFRTLNNRVAALENAGGGGGPHNHPINQIAGLQAALDGKSDTNHNHDAAYSPLGHNHNGVYEPAGAVETHASAVDPHPQYLTQPEGDARYVQVGSEWTYVRLTADFTTSSATAVDAGLGFAPAANQRYEFESQLMVRSTNATVNPRVGLAWATGLTDGVANIEQSQSATASLQAKGNINAALLIAVGAVPNTTQSWPATVWGMVISGASPSGSVRIQFASETAGTNVTIKAGSFIKYRTIP